MACAGRGAGPLVHSWARAGRRWMLAALAIGVGLGTAAPVHAEPAELPAVVQARLLSKIPSYEQGFRQRAGTRAMVIILTVPNSPESARATSRLAAALLNEPTVGGLPHASLPFEYTNADALKRQVLASAASIVYVTPGLELWLETICSTLEPLGVMTIAPVPEYVERCVSVGFDFVGGRPKLLVHLNHAQRAGLRFKSALLSLAKVYR
jgi:hypothetical protein